MDFVYHEALVVVKGGQDVGAITNSILPILGVVTIVTTFITPFIIRLGAKLNLTEPTEEGVGGSRESSSTTTNDKDKEQGQ